MQPRAERLVTLVVEIVHVLEHFPTDRLGDVGNGLLGRPAPAHPESDEGPQLGYVAAEHRIEGLGIASDRCMDQLSWIFMHGE